MPDANGALVSKEILGVGWHFPVRVDLASNGTRAIDRARGGIALARHEDDIDQAIRIILGTRPGERRMRPTFGCRVHELVFAPANSSTFGLMRRYVEDALSTWEPRIEIDDVDVQPSNDVEGQVDIAISFEVRATKDDRTLVYPFYVIGEE